MQISWGAYVVEALFRDHSNHGYDFMKAIGRVVRAIRRFYGDVPIIVATDVQACPAAAFQAMAQDNE